jgi:hypothetical protein
MLRTIARVSAVLAATAFAALVALYALLVIGSRRGVEYYYGK